MKGKLVYFGLTIVSFIACALIVILFNKNQFIRGFIGDIVVISLVYFFIKGFIDVRPLVLATLTLTIAFIVEFLQLLKIMDLLGIGYNPVTKIIFGSVFDVNDLLAYTIGAVLVYFIDTKIITNYLL